MILAFLHGVLDEEHFVDQTQQGIAQTGVLLVLGLCGEVVGNLALGIELFLEAEAAVSHLGQELLRGFGAVGPEEVVKEVVHDEWPGVQVGVKPEVVVVLQLVH